MSVNISLNRVLVAVLVAGIAAFCWWSSAEFLHASAPVAMWVFVFVLLALNASVTVS